MEDEILKTALAPSPECLSIDDLGRYADGALGGEQSTAALHIRGCPSCQAELALLHAVMAGGVRSGEAEMVREGVARLEQRAAEVVGPGRAEPSSRPRRFQFRLLSVSAAAAVLVVGIAAGSLYLRFARNPPALPGDVTTRDEVTRSLAIAVRGPIGDQIESPRRLEWLAVDRAVRYGVRLMEVDRREVWSTSTTALDVDLPQSVRTVIMPGKTLLWDVTAYDAAGTPIAQSGPQSFKLTLR